MTYSGLGAILFRFVGTLLIGAVLVSLFPAVASGPSMLSQVALTVAIALIPVVILIVAAKPRESRPAARLVKSL